MMDHRWVPFFVHLFFSLTSVYQIQLRVEIDETTGSAVLDFQGTGSEVRGNLNAPISVVHSAVIYCMRAMLDLEIPLNAGCLVPLESEKWHMYVWSPIELNALSQLKFRPSLFFPHHVRLLYVEETYWPHNVSLMSFSKHSMLQLRVKGVPSKYFW